MSKEAEIPAAPAAPPVKESIHRGRIGLNVSMQIILGLVIFILVNVLGHRSFRQWDYTYSRNFSLTENTRKFIGGIKEPVRITVLAPSEGMLEKDVLPLLDQYKTHIGGPLEVEFIDTKRDVAAWESFTGRLYRLGTSFKKEDEGVFVQSDRPHAGDMGGEKFFYKWIPQQSLYVFEGEKQVPIAFRGEALLNTAISGVVNPDRPRAAVVANMGNVRSVPNPDDPSLPRVTYAHMLANICNAQNIELEPWRMMQNPEYASRYKTAILVNTTLFGPQQDDDLTRFFETPGNSVVVLLDPEYGCDGMDKWLAKYGIQPQADRVLYAKSVSGGTYKQFLVDARFLDDSPITKGLENHATLLPEKTRSLKMLPDLEKVKSENIALKPLISPSEDFWGETAFQADLPRFDASEDHGKPLYVAVSAERGASPDPRMQVPSSRLVVVGNAGLANPPPSPENYEFLTRLAELVSAPGRDGCQ